MRKTSQKMRVQSGGAGMGPYLWQIPGIVRDALMRSDVYAIREAPSPPSETPPPLETPPPIETSPPSERESLLLDYDIIRKIGEEILSDSGDVLNICEPDLMSEWLKWCKLKRRSPHPLLKVNTEWCQNLTFNDLKVGNGFFFTAKHPGYSNMIVEGKYAPIIEIRINSDDESFQIKVKFKNKVKNGPFLTMVFNFIEGGGEMDFRREYVAKVKQLPLKAQPPRTVRWNGYGGEIERFTNGWGVEYCFPEDSSSPRFHNRKPSMILENLFPRVGNRARNSEISKLEAAQKRLAFSKMLLNEDDLE